MAQEIANSQNGSQVCLFLFLPKPNSFQVPSLANISSGFKINTIDIPNRYNNPE
jgi:hypothetical protein